MLQSAEFMGEVKEFLRMRDDVTVYDQEINGLIDSALATLKVAGVRTIKNALVSDYVKTFVRLRMLQDASDSFKKSESEREKLIIQQLVYGDYNES